MKTRNTVMLLLAAAAAVAFVVWSGRKGASTREQALSGGRLTPVNVEDVKRILIESGNTQTELDRRGTEWRMTRPIEDRADAAVVKALLMEVENLRSIERIEAGHGGPEGVSLGSLGLSQPKTMLSLITEGGTASIGFGREAPYAGTVYARTDGQKAAHVVKTTLRDLVLEEPPAFRDRSLLGFSVDDVEKLVIRRREGEIELARKGDGWGFVRPERARAAAARVEKLLELMQKTRIQEFRNERGPAVMAPELGSGAVRVFVYRAEGEADAEFQIERDEAAAGVAVVTDIGRGASGTIDSRLLDALLAPPRAFRDVSLARVNLDTVDAVVLVSPSVKLRLQRSGEGWLLAGSGGAPADPTLIEALVDLLAEEEGVEYLGEDAAESAAMYGFTAPSLRIEFVSVLSENIPDSDAGEHDVAVVEFGKREAERVYARNVTEGIVVAAPAAWGQAISMEAAFWEDRRFFRVDPREIIELTIRTAGGATFHWNTRDGEEWHQRSGSRTINERLLRPFLDALGSLRNMGEAERPEREADFLIKCAVLDEGSGDGESEKALKLWRQPDGGGIALGGVYETPKVVDAAQMRFLELVLSEAR